MSMTILDWLWRYGSGDTDTHHVVADLIGGNYILLERYDHSNPLDVKIDSIRLRDLCKAAAEEIEELKKSVDELVKQNGLLANTLEEARKMPTETTVDVDKLEIVAEVDGKKVPVSDAGELKVSEAVLAGYGSSVEHPSHYNTGSIEVWDALEDWGFGLHFCLGNVIKYVARAGHKGPMIEDLYKARQYIDKAIEIAEKDKEAEAAENSAFGEKR